MSPLLLELVALILRSGRLGDAPRQLYTDRRTTYIEPHEKHKGHPEGWPKCFIFHGRASGGRTPDLRIKSPSCKTRLLLNQLLATLANFQPNLTHGTNNLARTDRVTITSQRCRCGSRVVWL